MPTSSSDLDPDYGLTTAQIIYHMPDHQALLQEFIWQHLDSFPDFPVLGKFLAFWEEKIEGPIHSVTVAHARLIRPEEIRGMRSRMH
jgi:uncharacterized protein Usg